mmetsp:Transcript_18337/g.63127  ORF Transcript_18337/g.63127 Transcript_18337/m.63127 type:complete len:102 (+) Transcript_18337:920-1225(+)
MAEGPLQRYYMVGDNPASDMEGVRRANIAHRARGTAPWCGVLVRSGVFSDGDETNGAETVVHGVGEAVDWIIKNEQEQRPVRRRTAFVETRSTPLLRDRLE